MADIEQTCLYNNKRDKQWEMWDVELLNYPILLGICSWTCGDEGLAEFEYDYRDYWINGLTVEEAESERIVTIH